MTDIQERDRILRDMRLAEARGDIAKCQALLRELMPVTWRIRDAQEEEYQRQEIKYELAMMECGG